MNASPYLPLLRVDIGHGYFPDGRVRGLRFEPLGETARLLGMGDCVVREDGATLTVHTRAVAMALLRREHAPCLVWRLFVTDEGFERYTELPARAAGRVLHLDASTAPVVDLGDGRVTRALRATSRHLPPSLHEPYRGSTLALLSVPVPLDGVERSYRWMLRPRATVWTYRLIGDWPSAPLEVVDPSGAVSFDAPVRERAADGDAVLSIRSRGPIPLAARPWAGLHLRMRSPDGQRLVLIRRLPMAGAQHLRRDASNGEERFVSEIAVYR